MANTPREVGDGEVGDGLFRARHRQQSSGQAKLGPVRLPPLAGEPHAPLPAPLGDHSGHGIAPGRSAEAPLTAKVLETGQPVRIDATDACLYVQLPRELRGLELPVIALDVEGTLTT
ncbi:MAG: hypothetical protein HN849_34105 [Victivallales bacterium]|jgi:hypothetical protein|nr:hypothetical protein [Victivallales bacterium]MBT7304614.1 hypothetical protein [Victivallales bacterium]